MTLDQIENKEEKILNDIFNKKKLLITCYFVIYFRLYGFSKNLSESL